MSIFNVLITGLSAHVFMTYFFPNEYHTALLNGSFYAILFYSHCELHVKKLYNSPHLKPIKSFIDRINKKSEIDIIKFNEVMVSTNRKYVSVHQLLLYDFIMFSDYNSITEQAPKINRVLFFGIPKFPLKFDYKLCKFSFMSLNVTIKGTKYPIKLSNDVENYYVIGNKINILLIAHLLKIQHRVSCDEITGIYELGIIDHNVNVKTFTEKDEIILCEDDYTVKPFIYIDTSNMTVLDVISRAGENN